MDALKSSAHMDPLHYFSRFIKVEKFGKRVIQNSRGFLGGKF